MRDYDETTYGERMADRYDAFAAQRLGDPTPCVEGLARLAAGRPALELAIGTGRIALPLAALGVPVTGIDSSPAMVAGLRAKPGGGDIPVVMGDFADVAVEGRFGLVYVVFNTFFALLTQDDQIRCFENVAAHLEDDGLFVLELFVPDVARFDRGQRVQSLGVDLDRVSLVVSEHDPVRQVITSNQVDLRPDGARFDPVVIRYAWPAELDLIARLAGFRLRDRSADWAGSPFTAASAGHVSVYEFAGTS